MGIIAASLALLASGEIYTSYPAFGDQEPGLYSDRRVLVVTDQGPVRELIVQCREGEGVMIHDLVADAFCAAGDRCHKSLDRAIGATCAR